MNTKPPSSLAGSQLGMLLESSSPLPLFLCEQQLRASSTPAHPTREEMLQPRLQCQSARVRVHTCPPASPHRAGRLGSSGSSASGGRAAAFTGRTHKSWVQGSSEDAGRLAPVWPHCSEAGKGSRAKVLWVRHHVLGPGMGWETSTQERPRSPRKSQQELDGQREGWSSWRALPASTWHSNGAGGGTSSAEQLHSCRCRQRALWGPWPGAVPQLLGARAG